MKKLLYLLVLTLVLNFYVVSFAETKKEIEVTVDNKKLDFPDQQPYMDVTNRVMVPIRFVSEALGSKIDWDSDSGSITITKSDITIDFFPGSGVYISQAERHAERQTNPLPVVKNGRTFVPLRFVSENLGYKVDWDDKTRTVLIDTTKVINVLFKNPAMPEGMYSVEDDRPYLNFTTLFDSKECFEIHGVESYNVWINYATDLLEGVNNIDYRSVVENSSTSKFVTSEMIGVAGLAIKEESYAKWYQIVKDSTIVKESKFLADYSQISLGEPIASLGTYIIHGKLNFIFHKPTSIEYLKSYDLGLELEKWYSTDIELRYNRHNYLAGFRGLDYIIVGNKIDLVNK